MTEFTLGPWKAHQYEPTWQCATVQLSDKKTICDVFTQKNGNTEIAEANARLIAAAPDLLAALEEAEIGLRDLSDFYVSHINHNVGFAADIESKRRKARAAIAKARPQATSPYLNQPLRTVEQAVKDSEEKS